jgi:hypothetical protein
VLLFVVVSLPNCLALFRPQARIVPALLGARPCQVPPATTMACDLGEAGETLECLTVGS